VDQRVRAGEERRHLGREAEERHALDRAEANRQPAPQRLVASAHHDDMRSVECERRRDRALDVADAPAAARDDDDLALGREADRLPPLLPRRRCREARIVHAARRHDPRARPGDGAHLLL